MTAEQYLVFEETAETRHEFRDGVLIDMAGGTYAHSLIVANAIGELRSRLRGSACRALESNMKVRIPRKSYYYYPDGSVVCGEPTFEYPEKQTVLLNPRVLVGVLSDSTEAFDRGDKFADYREIQTLRGYILIAQHTPRVEADLRHEDGTWQFQPAAGLDAVVRIESVGVDLPLAEVYADVTFPPIAERGEAI